jgi:antagonist of KipI
VLWRSQSKQLPHLYAGRTLPAAAVRRYMDTRPPTVRIMVGPHAQISRHDLDALLSSTFIVNTTSDRAGVRLVREDLDQRNHAIGGETISEGMPRGAIQVPPGGEPIILLADHQTTGGYRVPAVVASVDLWRVAQLRAGEKLRFALVTRAEAVAALRERAAWLERLGAGEEYGALDDAMLMRGFAEWSEEASDE